MDFQIVRKENINMAINIQHELFPMENGSEDFKEAIHNKMPDYLFLKQYWLAKINNKYIGIYGLYSYKFEPKDAWLGWFGVVENERRKGYGTSILKFTMQKAKQLGFENFRLYTDEEDNANAVKLYKKLVWSTKYIIIQMIYILKSVKH